LERAARSGDCARGIFIADANGVFRIRAEISPRGGGNRAAKSLRRAAPIV